MFRHLSGLIKPFLLLWLFTAAGIFLHELGHHLFGIQSMVSLSRNWPLVPVTDENKSIAIIGSLAGPLINLLFGYIGLIIFKFTKKNIIAHSLGMFFGLANSFLALSAAIINLIVDSLSGVAGNDLQVVSTLSGLNILILPAAFLLLSLPPLKVFWQNSKKLTPTRIAFSLLIFAAWLAGGASLMLLDSILTIRFRLI